MTKVLNLTGLGVPAAVASEIGDGVFDAGVSGTTGTFTGVVNANAAGIRTRQAVSNVNDTTPTAAELTAAFGAPATLGRGFVATVDDNDGDTNGYICWTSDASWYFLKGTKAS